MLLFFSLAFTKNIVYGDWWHFWQTLLTQNNCLLFIGPLSKFMKSSEVSFVDIYVSETHAKSFYWNLTLSGDLSGNCPFLGCSSLFWPWHHLPLGSGFNIFLHLHFALPDPCKESPFISYWYWYHIGIDIDFDIDIILVLTLILILISYCHKSTTGLSFLAPQTSLLAKIGSCHQVILNPSSSFKLD